MNPSTKRHARPYLLVAAAVLGLLLSACGSGGGGGEASYVELPSLSVADASVIEGDSGTTDLTFTLTLSEQANGDVNVDYATSDGSTTAGDDYTAASGTLTISGGTTSNTSSITVNGDATPEADETLTLTLSNVSANATLGPDSATGTILNDDATGTLNDTGITLCGDYAYDGGSGIHDNALDCEAVGATATVDGTDSDGDQVPAGQDAHFGRDVSANDDSDGHAGFAFTKIDSEGNPLAADASSWHCVLDNTTGLIWEVKTDDDGLRDKDWTYTWYNSTGSNDGGGAGTENGGACVDSSNCDTEKYVVAVNSATLCGSNDWRLPSLEELHSLMDYSTYNPAIDSSYFPNTKGLSYWSSSPFASDLDSAWRVRFKQGYDGYSYKSAPVYVRLVRGEQ